MPDITPTPVGDPNDPYDARAHPIRHILFKHVIPFVAAILAALAFAAVGAFVLFTHHTALGLIVGVILIVLAVGIALPVQLSAGAAHVKEVIVLIVPTIMDVWKKQGSADGEEK